MRIWSRIVREYFCCNDKGTPRQITNWALNNKLYWIKDFIREDFKQNKMICYGREDIDTGINEEEYVTNYIKSLYYSSYRISTTCRYLFFENKLNRKESLIDSSKWCYYYPTKPIKQ